MDGVEDAAGATGRALMRVEPVAARRKRGHAPRKSAAEQLVARRAKTGNLWTADKIDLFLRGLAATGDPDKAARELALSPVGAQSLRWRDRVFRELYDQAKAAHREAVEATILNRAAEGVKRRVEHADGKVEVEYDARLSIEALRLLNRTTPPVIEARPVEFDALPPAVGEAARLKLVARLEQLGLRFNDGD